MSRAKMTGNTRQRAGKLGGGLAVMLVAALSSPGSATAADPAASEATVTPDVMVNAPVGPTRTLEYPALAANPDNQRQLVMGAVDVSNGRCLAFRSENGGLSWAESPLPDASMRCELTNHNFFPTQWGTSLAYENGTAYYAFSARHEASDGTSRSVYLARSTDNGRSWQTSTVYQAAPGQGDQGDVNVRPDVALSPSSDDVYVSWRHPFAKSTDKPSELRVAASRDGGRTFEAPVALDRPGPIASLVATADGVYAFFPPELTNTNTAPNAPLPPTPIVVSKSTDGGRTWRSTEINAGAHEVSPVQAAALPNGDLVAVWNDNRAADAAPVDLRALASHSTDGGKTWSDPVMVDRAVRNGGEHSQNLNQLYPTVDVASNSRVDVVWYDYRNDPFPIPDGADSSYLGKVADVYAASSRDGGASFGPAVRLTDRSIDRRVGTWQDQYFLNAHPAVASTPSGFAAAWSDTRYATPDTGTQDIFFASGSYSGDGLLGVTGENGTSTGRLVALAAGLTIGGAGVALLIAALFVRSRPKGAAT